MSETKLLQLGKDEALGHIRLSAIEVNGVIWVNDYGDELGDLIALKGKHEFVIKLDDDGVASVYRRDL